MELHEKLQELRKSRGLTQEQLAQQIYVSRTAISKWESGRGTPSIDSLKALSAFFAVSVDELLSGDAILTLAQEETKQRERRVRNLVFGLLDCCAAMLFFLPFFGQRMDGAVQAVSLLAWTGSTTYIKVAYLVMVSALTLWGVLLLALQNWKSVRWLHSKEKISLSLHVMGTLLLIMGLQPYAAAFLFFLLLIKAILLIKWA